MEKKLNELTVTKVEKTETEGKDGIVVKFKTVFEDKEWGTKVTIVTTANEGALEFAQNEKITFKLINEQERLPQ